MSRGVESFRGFSKKFSLKLIYTFINCTIFPDPRLFYFFMCETQIIYERICTVCDAAGNNDVINFLLQVREKSKSKVWNDYEIHAINNPSKILAASYAL